MINHETPPPNLRSLTKRIANRAENPLRAESDARAIALIALSQMLPEGAIKGGTSMKLRLGEISRSSKDLDFAQAKSLEKFEEELQNNLRTGWAGFSGTVTRGKPAKPKGVPPEYVMTPFQVRLAYKGSMWRNIDLEVGHEELGDTDHAEFRINPGMVQLFTRIGLLAPSPVPVQAAHHQIAQKLHGTTRDGSDRAHDLVDLQLLVASEKIDWQETKRACVMLFAYRKQHAWPPAVLANPNWESLYAEAASGMPVLATVDQAIDWANGLIAKIIAS